MSVKYTATWTCDGCKAKADTHESSSFPPKGWAWVVREKNVPKTNFVPEATSHHYCPKCAKEKGL